MATKIDRIYAELATRFGIRRVELSALTNSDTQVVDRQFRKSEGLIESALGTLARSYDRSNLVFTPPRDDAHEDHAFTGRVVRSAFRQPHNSVLEYEVKHYTDRSFMPNVFVGLDDEVHEGLKLGELKTALVSRLAVDGKNLDDEDTDTAIEEAEYQFGEEIVNAKLLTTAQEFGGNKRARYGEAFRGSVTL